MRRSGRFYIWCGPASLALLVVALIGGRLLPLPAPGQSATHLAAYYAAHRSAIRIGLVLAMFGAALLGPWSVMLARSFRQIDGPDSPSADLQLIFGALLVFEVLLPLVFLEVAVFRPDRPPVEIQAWSDACWLPLIGLVFTLVIELLFGAYTIWHDPHEEPILPRWLAVVDVGVAVCSIPSAFDFWSRGGAFAWNGVLGMWIPLGLFGAWLGTTTYAMLQTVNREIPLDARLEALVAQVNAANSTAE